MDEEEAQGHTTRKCWRQALNAGNLAPKFKLFTATPDPPPQTNKEQEKQVQVRRVKRERSGACEMDGADTFALVLGGWVLAFRRSSNICLRATIARVIPKGLLCLLTTWKDQRRRQ